MQQMLLQKGNDFEDTSYYVWSELCASTTTGARIGKMLVLKSASEYIHKLK